MLRKMVIALVLCGLTAGAFAQGGKMETKDAGKGKMEKKSSQARDAKGHFIKKDKGAVKTTAKMPERDAKGRFIKKGEADMKTTVKSGKKMPMRDPKTGRFMKKADAAKTTDKTSTGKMEKKK